MAALNDEVVKTGAEYPRLAQRRSVRLSAVAITASDGQTEPVELLNLSERGFLLQSAASFRQGDTLEIELPEAGTVEASVVWDNAPHFGCEFTVALPRSAVSASLLRSPALHGVVSAAAAPTSPAKPQWRSDFEQLPEPANDIAFHPRTKLAIWVTLSVLCWAPIIGAATLLRG